MIRKLLLLVAMTVSAFAMNASAASAFGVVIVENPGMFEVEGELTFATVAHVSPTTEIATLRCEYHMEYDISWTGHVDIHEVHVDPHSGQTGNCADADDCGNAGWEGQFEEIEPSNPERFELHWTICYSGTGSALDGIPFPIECAQTEIETHCDYVIIPGAGTPTSPRVEVVGELNNHPANDGILPDIQSKG